MEVFFEIHSDNPREGPGNFNSTKRAFKFLKNLPKKPIILDIGCGPSKQTFDLLKISDAKITAIDNYQPYLDSIQNRIKIKSLSNRLQVFNKNMVNLDFDTESFDIIWSEGAIYIMGFENGLNNWKKFLKPNGYIAVTELSWLNNNPPQDLYNYWNNAYPKIQSIKGNLEIIKKCGYKLINHCTLSEDAWWDYYNPIINKLPNLKVKYANNQEALTVIEEDEFEIEL